MRDSIWKKAAVIGLPLVLIPVGFLWLYGTRTAMALHARWIGHMVPVVNFVPRELPDSTTISRRANSVSELGAQFDIPWSDIDPGASRSAANCTLTKFKSGRSMVLCSGPPDMFMAGAFKNQHLSRASLAAAYGDDALSSDYSLFSAIYSTTPSALNPFLPPIRAEGLQSGLVIKALTPPLGNSAIFYVHSPSMRGFQLGDPSVAPKKLAVLLCDENAEFELNFEQRDTQTGPITQANLNLIIQSLRREPTFRPQSANAAVRPLEN